jgi:hypothetical protein
MVMTIHGIVITTDGIIVITMMMIRSLRRIQRRRATIPLMEMHPGGIHLVVLLVVAALHIC